MAQRVVRVLRWLEIGERRGLDPGGHPLGPKEGVEVAMLATAKIGRMGVIVVLAVRLVVVDVALGIVVPLVEFALAAQDLADHVRAGFAKNAVAFENPVSRPGHYPKALGGKASQFRHPMGPRGPMESS